MSHLDTLPPVVALLVAVLALIGAALALIGTLGLAVLPRFYDRIHASTLATSWGLAAIVLASMLLFSFATGRLVLRDLALAVLVTVTAPITLTLLARAALHRERAETAEAPGTEPPRTGPPTARPED